MLSTSLLISYIFILFKSNLISSILGNAYYTRRQLFDIPNND